MVVDETGGRVAVDRVDGGGWLQRVQTVEVEVMKMVEMVWEVSVTIPVSVVRVLVMGQVVTVVMIISVVTTSVVVWLVVVVGRVSTGVVVYTGVVYTGVVVVVVVVSGLVV